MKIVITGALGHIGSHLIREFPRRLPGVEIVMVDNLATQRYASLFDLPTEATYRFIEADVTRAELSPIVEGADAVIHLAALTDAAGSFARASEVEQNNFTATRNVATACADAGAPLIALSTTSVYGTQSEVVSEECAADELKPQSPYATTKLREEALVRELAAARGLRAVSLRFGTIFGTSPGMRFHTAVNKFCWQAVMGQPITVWTTAYDQKRPYLDLRDASRAIAFFIARELFDGRVYNVVTLNSTVRQIVDSIREFVPDLDVDFVESPIMNQLSYEVSTDRLLTQGFEYEGDLSQGIRATVELLAAAGHRRLGVGMA